LLFNRRRFGANLRSDSPLSGYYDSVRPSPAAPLSTRSGTGPSDAALVLAARAGEMWAQEALFRRYAGRLNGLAFRIMGRDDDIDDLVQDAFEGALWSLDRLEDPNAFGSWIASILIRMAHKVIRRRRMMARFGLGRAALTIDVDDLAAVCTSEERIGEVRRLYGALAELPADVRLALVLCRVEGYSLVEVARVMQISLSTARRRVTEGEARVRAQVGGRTT
jgi:RNA polymerase sigma-70 factor, ECF subfamily